jgi:phage repressor protein C with HTH and peptisase S24 domain
MHQHSDIVILSPDPTVRRGDPVAVKTKHGEVVAKILRRQTSKGIELASFDPEHDETEWIATEDVEWMARIIWASQ